MEFKNYCVLIMGSNIDKDKVQSDILSVSQDDPRFIDAEGIFFTTFMSSFKPNELKDLFTGGKRSVLVFELNEDTSASHMDDNALHKHLFGKLTDSDAIRDISDSLMNEIRRTSDSGMTTDNITRKPIRMTTKKNTKESLSKLSKTQLQTKIDEILDKGIENLTKEDKKLLKLLSKYK